MPKALDLLEVLKRMMKIRGENDATEKDFSG